MSTRPLLKQLSWLLFGILLATTSTSQAQTNPCQQSQQLCMNGAICRQAYLNPGYICECQGEWQGQNCEQRFPGITPSIPKECGSNFYSDSGVIVSTNYPLPPNDNEDCFYLVRIPSAESITFYFDAFHSENHKDGLIIYPGTTVNDQLPDLRTFIGTDQIAPQTVNTNQVVLYWYTDFNVPSGGFSIRYEADPDPCWVNPCQNGGLCNRIGGTGAGYQCNCPPDFSGVNCEIGTVIVAQTTIGVNSGIPVIQGRLSQSFTFDLTFSPGQTQFVLTGTGLWSVSLYLRDNLGNQFATQNVNVNNQQSSVSWQPPSASTIFSLQTTLNTNALSCTQVASICGVIGRGQSPSTPFSIRGVQGSTSLAGCTTVQCRGLEITQVDFGSSLRTLREGVNNQNIQFDFTAYTNPQAGQVSGTNLWKFTLFGSTQPNGLGNRVLTRSLTLNQGQLNAVPGPNGNIQFLGLETALSLNGLTCSQVQYICVTLGKADNPSPDFTMSGTPSDAVLTVCQSTTCRGVQVTDTSISVTSGTTLLERQSNTVGFTLSIFSSSSGGSVSGSNLFNIKTFGSNTQTGTSIRISERDVPGNIGITAGVLAVIPNLSTMLDLNNLLCQQVVALCTELSKGVNANPDFTLEPVQSTDVLQDCINMECRGVYISLMTINPTVNRQLQYGNRNHMLTFNLRIQADSPSASISGSNLWQLVVFASNQLNGQGTRRGQAVVTLTQSQMSAALSEGGQINFNNLQVTMDLSSVTSCAEIIYLCVQLQKSQAPNPDFTLQGNTVQCLNVECTSYNPCVSNPCQNNGVCSNTGNSYTCSCANGWTGTLCGTAVNACINHRCENGAVCLDRQFNYECQCTFGWTGNFCNLVDSGVILSRIQLFLANLALREGTANNNNLNFNLMLTSDASGQTVSGTGLWSFNVFGSSQLDGSGQRYGLATAVYNSAQFTQLTAGGTLPINGVQASLDLSQVVCSQVPYLCVEVVPGASASPAFRLSGDQVECAQINCQGVNIVNTQLQVVSSTTVVERDSSSPLTVDMTITTSPTSAGVSGLRLWRVTTFLSTQPDGSGTRFGQSVLQLSDAQSGLTLIPGQSAVMSALSVSANAASLMCGQFGYICAQLQKSPSSTVDFTLNSPSYVACAPVTCKGVEITDVVGTISSGVPVYSDTQNNVVVFDVTVSSNPNGASISGANLWEVIVFSDSQLDGQGTTVIQNSANLPGSSGSIFLQAGIDMVIRGAQVSLDLNGISCNQIPYICVQLRKAPNPNPDFTFTPVPSDDVLVHCQRLTCNACRSQNCLNGAVCVDVDPGLFRCDCTPGWTGTFCGIVADFCLTTQLTCLNGGQCVSQSSSTYQCTCPQEWVGLRCQTDNPCLPNNPCLNGGTCFTDQNGIYTCTCINGYIGQNCHIAPNPCVSNPCQNGGICERIGTGSNYDCLCTFGFEGQFCETLLDPCNSSPCLNGGNCSGIDMTYVYQCQCAQEYEGTNCQSRKNPCANNPCLNGGVCNQIGSANYQCSCTVGYTGTNCGSLINPCNNNPCLNNGRCIWSGTTIVYQCQCNAGFSGDNCQTFNMCVNVPCQNGGVCSQAGSSFTCQCAPGYTGNTCTQVINFCLANNNPCQNGGTCLPVGTSYQCQCLSGYTGNTCTSVIINACVSIPCLNGGVCSQFGSAFQCQCQTGYSGLTCNVVQNFCLANNNPCRNGGTCLPVGTSWRCQCLSSYTGNTCTIAVVLNPCLNNPCLNGGACQSGAGSTYTCQCTFGFTGLNCENQMTGCASNPCLNGGQCFQEGTGYRCQCLAGYTGTRCNVLINPCSSNPCQNNGICNWLNPTFAYQCQCQQSFSGVHCEIVTDPCISSPCFNGATCRLLGTNFQCQCAPGYTGNLCTQPINPCSSNPCLNRGVCSWLSPNFIYRCQCSAGYTGVNCGSVIDPCVSSPCLNGATCRLLGTNFQCQCAPGYTGNRCSQVLNPCSTLPCLNNGFCQWSGVPTVYTCQCTLGFVGTRCQTPLNPCNSNPCQNSGFCNWQSPNYAYQCQCPQTFTGINCETPIGPCFSNPCVNGGQCFTSNSGAGYFCNCMGNFKGINCQYPEPCFSNPCINNGDCNSPITGSSYTCTCLNSYQGPNCQYPNPCNSQPCQNGGLCSPNSVGTSFQCNCPSNFLGVFCQIGNPCISNPCLNGGACRTDTTGSTYFCNCVNNFIGLRCQFTNPCSSNPCQNGAICSQANSGQTYTCSCINGFFGTNCETPDPCRSFPCSNGGNCIITNGGFGYNCNCPQQFMGVTCQYPNPCSSNPCLNGGFCESHPLGISYTCSCPANFQGVNCAIRNPCASNPCINGGVCQLGVDGTSFFCNCPQQYMGLRCENLNPCLQQPCQNGGTCTPLSQGLEYRCSCLPSFYGITCEIRDPCSSSPCLNGGVCSQTASGYFCSCPTGFNGINCNNMNPCGGNPCQNGGTCVESAAPSGFFCRCTSAYIGTTCTIPDPCISNPCRNGGTCNRDSQGTIYSCICVTGYAGRDCEFGPNCFSVSDFRCGSGECVSLSRQCDRSFDCTDGSDENNCQVACTAQEFTCAPGICISRDLICNGINNCNNDLDEQNCPLPCDSGPCLNGGICSNVGTSFICTCTSGWMGVTCAIPTTGSNAAPVFGGNSYTTIKPESIAVGSNIFHLVATDVDSPSLTFSLEDEVAKQLFIVVPDGPYGAYLTLKQQLDREVQDVYEFVVSVSDGANQVLQGGTLLVSDVNDNAPTFTNLPNTTTVHENVNFGYNVFVVNAEDRDATFAGAVTYSISEDTPGPFTINAFTGTVTVSGNLDYETDEVYNIKIIAKDSATNSLSTEEYLTINIVDVQDAGPEFLNPPYDTAIDEGTPVNTVVQQVVAVDKDTLNPNTITYSIISGNQGSFFALNSNTGEITVIRELDREDPNLPPSVEFNIRAMENGPGGGQSAFTTFSIAINDLNDEPPMFDQSVYSVSVSEAELPGYVLPVNIHVTDGDVMIQGNFRITLQIGNIVPFSVSPSSAVDQATVTLTLIRPLDYETTKTYNLQLFAEDSASSSATVVVTVTDANDNNPLFTNPIQPITLREGSLQNTPVITISTTDADEGTNAVTKYRIVGGNQDNLFTINPDTGVITTTSNVDYENSARTYTLTIEAYNTAPAVPPATGVSITTLVVSIEDINDNPPVFQPSFYNRTVYEDADTGRTIVRVFASDADAGPAGDIRYSIIGGNVDGSFSINAQTGDVILMNRLDRETLDFYDIVIRAEDNVVPSQSATAHLTVYVGDSNDNSPQWSQLQYSQSLLEGLPANTFVTQVSATDIDLGMNAKLQYYLATPSQYFWINQTTGQIYTSMPLDREQMESITLNVMVRDLGNPQRNSAQPATVMVTVLDVNDTPPTFTGIPYNFEVAENRPFGTSVGQATAQDPDTIGTLVYSILSQTSNFFIDSTTGRITTINSLDREQLSNYEFEVQVTDGLHMVTETVAVTVTDENDNDPVFTGGSLYELTVVENMPAGLILRLQATDADEGLNKKIVYQFDPTSNPPFGLFYLDQETGELRTTGPLDREVQDMYTLVVVAKDRNGEPGGRSAIATVLVTVTDVNDNKPYFDLQSYSQSVPEDIVLGGFITKVEAIDRDIGENAVILYRIIEGNEENHFSIDTNGTITRGPVPLDRETKVFYQLSVEAYNAGDLQPRNTATVTITVTDVNDEVPVFTQNVYLRPDLMENSPGGTQVATVLANDPDEGLGGQVLYSLTGGDSGFFFIDSQNGIITVQGSLPGFDVQQSYNLTVTATDQAQPFHSSTSTVMVHLVDAQDDPPEFTMDKYEVHLDENTGQGYPFLQVAAAIPGKPNSVVTYSLEPNVNPIILELFELDAATGMLTTKKPIDYEAGQNLYTFTVLGESDGVLSGSTAVWVYIDDVNDNNPVFVNPQTEVTVTENNNPGFIFTTVTATDADFGQNAELVYVITGGNQLGHFDLVTDVNGATHIATSTSLDREAIENYTLTITAADKGEPSRNSSINITVNVGDVNDNAPMYNQTINAASVVENILLNRPIGTIVFTDFDLPSSNNVEFYIDDMSNPNGIFQINSLGQITMTGPLDRESQAFYDLVVVMRDQTFNAGFSETTHFYINVTDQNDNQPIFPPQPPVIVTEGPSSTGNIFVTVTADDNDFGQNSNVIYTITGGNADGIFGIHQNNGSIYVIKELDWESTKNYELIVTATDQAGNVNDRRTGTVTVTVNVEDINDTPPVFPMNYYGPYNFYEGVSGTYIGTFVASDADSGLGGQITYTLIGNLSNLFFIHPDTGVLSLKPTAELDYEFISDFNLTIIATDAGTPSFSGNTTVGINVLNINDHSPQFIGTPYRVSINDTEAIGSLVFNVMATDADVGPDGNITYSIFDGNTGEMFWINPLTGNVYVNKTLTNGAYVLIVKAKDNPLNPQDSKEATGTLTILVTDSTSTIPVLINNGLFNADVFEHSPEGTYVTTVAVANPADVGQLTYSISGPDAAPFFINPVTGIITVSGVLDIEVKDRHVFEVTAIGSSGVSATGSVDVNILNINDYPPVIGQTFNFSVPEDATNDHFVGVVTATDQDYGSTTFHFSILSGGEDKFAIDPDTGTITVFSVCRGDVCDPTPLDREIKDLYTLNVQVSDLGSPLLSAQEVVYIHVTDVNDFRPAFDFTNIVVSVEENAMLNKPITTVQASDQDLSASLIYIIESVTATDLFGNTPSIDVSQWFSINSTTGVVYVSGQLDRENASEVVLTISGTDLGSNDAATSTTEPDATVTISITDINEHGPVFQPDGTTVIDTSVQEESAVGTIIINVEAIDPDNPINGMVTYMLTGNSSQYAYINPLTGQITVNKNIDRELLNWLNFTVVATDSGNPSLSTSIPITVQVLDVNDNNPVFNQSEYVTTVTENTGSGTFVIVTPATDKDKGQYGTVTYKLTGGNGFFTIDSNTGEITTLQSLDQETQGIYTLTVTATDNEGGSDSRQNTTTVVVYVGDVNEHAPTVNPNFNFDVDENLPNRTFVGVIDATDADNPMETFNFTFTFANPSDGNNVFYIDKNTGEIFTNQQIDSDSSLFAKNYTFTILVSDNGNPSKTTETTTTINIKDLNDNNPVFVNAPYNITISELFTGNVMTVTGQDIDKNSILTYKIINGNSNDTFFINPSTGVITVSNRLDFESRKKYNLTLLVEDQDGRSSTSHVVINIKDANDQTPVFVGPLPYQFNVFENVALGTDVGTIFATDADSDPTNSQLTYHIVNNVPFTINEITGLIETSGMLDRETQDRYLLDVQVRNQGHTVDTQVLINILDVNDNAPTFGGEDNITRSFPENSEGNFPIYQPSATDADIGENARITYSIVSGNVENIFSINPKTGAIVLSRPITTLTDLVHNFKLIVEARDNGTNKLYSNITLNMVVGDYNDNGPVFIHPNVTVLTLPENQPIGYIISSILATDRDTGTNGMVTYGFLNEDGTHFTLQPDGDGALLLSNFIADREKQDRYTLVLLASDGSDTNKRETPLELTILITDENDNEPFFIRLDENTAVVQFLNITEHSSSGTSTGTVNQASDLDLAPFNNIYYYIVGGNGNGTFRIDKNTGEIFVVGDLDRETTGFHNLIVKATNNATYVPSGIFDVTTDTTLKQIQIEVKDINDNGPQFNQKIYISSILTNAEEQTQVSCIRATDVDLGDSVDYTIQSVSYTLDGQTTTFDDTFYIEKGTGCIRSNKILTGVGAGGFFDISVVATDNSGKSDSANVRVFTLDDKQKVVLIVDGSREDVIKQQAALIEVLKSITGGEVVIDDVTTYINENGVLVPGQTMVTFHVIDQNTNSAIAAAEILRLIDINRATINTLFQKYAVVEAFALGGGAGGAAFGILEAALLAIALLLFLGALIFIIILCCLQRRFLKKIHGNSPAVIYATRADADVKEAAAYQGSNPLWLESADSYPDDWPDSISLLGGGVNREYESQEASMDFFSDMQTEVARDALVMTALVNDGSMHGQAGTGRVKTLSNGGVASNGRISSNGRLAGGGVAASGGGFGSGAGRSGAGRSGAGMSSTTTTQMSSSGARLVDGIDGSAGTLTNRLNRDGSVTANLNSGAQDGGYSGSSASYTYSSVGFGGPGPSASGSQRLTSDKAHEIRQMLNEDETVEATFLDGTMYGNGDNSAGMAAARAVYREDVEFENQLSPITEEDTTSSWSSWTRDSERSGGRHPGGTLERNRTTGRSSKDYQDPMNNYTTSTSVEENYTHSIKKPSQTESSSYSRRANSKTYSAGVPTSIGMVTLTEETPEMIGLDADEDSEAESSIVDGRTYTYNVMGDNASEGAHSLSGTSSGHSSSRRKETNMITQEDDDDDDDEAGEIIEETETRRSKKTTRAYTNSGYDDYMDEESRL